MSGKPTYRRAALLYNPASGQRRHLRFSRVQAAASTLNAAGIATTLIATEASGTAGQQATAAVAAGHDAVFACGGDGTVHDVLQGMVAGAPEVPLGIIPLGTGNVLAFDLGIPRDPARAIQAQLSFVPRRIAAGHIEFQARDNKKDSRYFTLMAGVGPEALMLYRVHAELKKRVGVLEYFRQAMMVVLSHPHEEFLVHYLVAGERRTASVAQFSALRVTAVGNRVRYFTTDSALHHNDFHAIMVSTPNRLLPFAYLARRWVGQRWKVRGVESALSTELICEAKPGQEYAHGIYAQADGELLGTLPVAIRMVPNAFTLLMPAGR
jgi:diacylglycerol kinase (ATP)